MYYLYIKYPDELLYVKPYVSHVQFLDAKGFFKDLGCFVAATDAVTCKKYVNALGALCEMCRVQQRTYSTDTQVYLCRECVSTLSRESEVTRQMLKAQSGELVALNASG